MLLQLFVGTILSYICTTTTWNTFRLPFPPTGHRKPLTNNNKYMAEIETFSWVFFRCFQMPTSFPLCLPELILTIWSQGNISWAVLSKNIRKVTVSSPQLPSVATPFLMLFLVVLSPENIREWSSGGSSPTQKAAFWGYQQLPSP